MPIQVTNKDISTRGITTANLSDFSGRDRQVVIQIDDPKGYRPVIMDGTTVGGKTKVALVADLSDYVSESTYNSDKAGFETTANASTTYATKTELSSYATKSELTSGLAGKADSSHKHTKADVTDFPTLATVATSGSYNDLSDKPTIPESVDVSGLIPKTGARGQLVGYENVTTVNTEHNGINITMRANGIKYKYGDGGIETEQELPDVLDLDTGGGGITIGVADTTSLISATKAIRVATACGSITSDSHVVWASGSVPVVEPPFMLVLHFQTGTCLAQYHSLIVS